MMPRVSVIVPNFNHRKFLPERLETIMSQSFQDFEIILLDDCSSDGSREYCGSMRGKAKVKEVILNPSNGGSAFKQWEKGIEAASGELVWIAESDDSCEKGLLETLVAEFDGNPSCVLAFCSSMLTSENGERLGVHRYQNQIGKDLRLAGMDFVRNWLLRKNYVVNASGALFKRSAALEVDDAHMKYKGVGDWLFWTEIAIQGDIAFVNKPLNLFRQHENNTTSELRTSGRALLELRELQKDFERLGFRDARIFLSNRIYAVHSARYSPDAIPSDVRREVLKAWGDNPFISFLALLKQLKEVLK